MTALAFAATIDDPGSPNRARSGETDWSGRISRNDAALLRSLLFKAASNLLTFVRKARPLKDWARRIRMRTVHKKACVAMMHNRAVTLHRMPASGKAFRWPQAQEGAAA